MDIFRKNRSGFTLIELLVTIAILAIIVGFGSVNFFRTRSIRVFAGQVDRAVSDVRFTMARSRVQEGGDGWGIRYHNPAGDNNDYYEVWSGSVYPGTIYNRVNISPGVEFTTPGSGSFLDVEFQKSTGLPTVGTTIRLQSTNTGGYNARITVSSRGVVDYDILAGS